MEANKRKRVSVENPPMVTEEDDRISDLPDAILYHILSFLPIKYVAPTSVLSTRWQKLWISLPYLNFDDDESISGLSFHDFMDIVQSVLSRRDQSTNLIRFRISWCKRGDTHDVDEQISSCISHVFSAGVQEIDIYHAPRLRIPKLSPSFSHCKTLVSLKLYVIVPHPYKLQFPNRFCFPKMKTMHLKYITVDMNFANQLLQSSPNLEKLVLDSCHIDADSSSTPNQNHPNFSNLDSAVIRSTCSKNEIHARFLSDIMSKLSNVKDLHLFYPSTKVLQSYHNPVLPTFCYLKHLEIQVGDDDGYTSLMARFLKCSPVLQSLRIRFLYMGELGDDDNRKLIQVQQLFSRCVPGGLKCITVDKFYGSKNQIEVLRLFLENAQKLEKMIIYMYEHGLKDPILFREELLKFSRPSVDCLFDIHTDSERPGPLYRPLQRRSSTTV